MKMNEKEIAAELAEKYCVKVEMNEQFLKEYSEKLRSGELFLNHPIDQETILTKKIEKLKDIAFEILEQHETCEMQWIENFSWNPEKQKAELKAEVERYRRKIEEVTK